MPAANRAVMEMLNELAVERDMWIEIELLGAMRAGAWCGYLRLQVCRRVGGNVIVELERRLGDSGAQLGRGARELHDELREHTIIG